MIQAPLGLLRRPITRNMVFCDRGRDCSNSGTALTVQERSSSSSKREILLSNPRPYHPVSQANPFTIRSPGVTFGAPSHILHLVSGRSMCVCFAWERASSLVRDSRHVLLLTIAKISSSILRIHIIALRYRGSSYANCM
jgi:hypothetical protein